MTDQVSQVDHLLPHQACAYFRSLYLSSAHQMLIDTNSQKTAIHSRFKDGIIPKEMQSLLEKIEATQKLLRSDIEGMRTTLVEIK